jgi:hypothetical protein
MVHIYSDGKLEVCKHMENGIKMILQTANYKELKAAWVIAKILRVTTSKREIIIDELKRVVKPILENDLLSVVVITDIIYNTAEFAMKHSINLSTSILNELNFKYDSQLRKIEPIAKITSCDTVKVASAICAQCSEVDSEYNIYCFEDDQSPRVHIIRHNTFTEGKAYIKVKEENTFYV